MPSGPLSGSMLVRLNAGVLGSSAVVALFAVFALAEDRAALLVLGAFGVGLATLVAGRSLARAVAERRTRQAYLVTLGRFTGQMAHDLEDPLAAARSAAELLIGELDGGRSTDGRRDHLEPIGSRRDGSSAPSRRTGDSVGASPSGGAFASSLSRPG